MSTNAAIGMTMPDGTIKAVYLHWDGYIKDGGAGETLADGSEDTGWVYIMNNLPVQAKVIQSGDWKKWREAGGQE